MKVTLEVAALETCKPNCPNLDIEECGTLLAGDTPWLRLYRCRNKEYCKALLKNLQQTEVEG